MVFKVFAWVADVDQKPFALDAELPIHSNSASNRVIGDFEGNADLDAGKTPLSLNDGRVVAYWCRRHGICVEQLVEATIRVGLMPAALHFYLSSHGRPTKKVTQEMRAARPPKSPRDRRKKIVVNSA